MIAIQKIGKSFSGALNYNLQKLFHPEKSKRAEILATNFASVNAKSIHKEVQLLRSLRPNLNRYVYHTSLNFPQEEQSKLSNEKLLAIATDYLNTNGFTNNQYIIFRHHDTDHPHIHLLVNRIRFDGSVVSDSNNYRRSEAILRELEYRYNLVAVEQSNFAAVAPANPVSKKQGIRVTRKQSNYVSRRPPTRNEVGMIARTGKASGKLLLQELLNHLIAGKPKSISEFVERGEKVGIHFLFNQSDATGRVSGITYFFKDFKAKGQSLGTRYKWAELIKQVSYNQIRDGNAISESNIRTKAIYGENLYQSVLHPRNENDVVPGRSVGQTTQGIQKTFEQTIDSIQGNSFGIQITDDVDDEAIYGKNRHRQRKARTNAR